MVMLYLIGCHNVFSQSCLPEGITFSTQSQIDSFLINHPGCTEIEGSVTISGNDITNLQGLQTIKMVHQWLDIIDNENLSGLEGLNQLDSIGHRLYISGNSSLISLEGLNSLRHIGWDFSFYDNHSVKNFMGLTSLKYIGGTFDPQVNDSLQNFNGLDSLNYIGDNFIAFDNPLLFDFSGLEALSEIGGLLWIRKNNLITSLSGLNGLEKIKGGLEIDLNENLINLEGITSLINVDVQISISDNASLIDISSLGDIELPIMSDFSIYLNPNLSECAIPSFCNYLDMGGYIYINNNATGCNSREEVDSICTQIGIDEFENILSSSIEVYPNPANNTLCLSIEEPVECVEVFNMQGKLLLRKEYEDGIPVSGLSPGVYFLKAYAKDQVLVARFLKE